ncbi:MAG: GNAT family N-acetyltransferase [Methanosarcinales archaeon]|jgi:ribosomal protein S18 acetylase RimI-like enzyme|nr:GNAT family N-acetyltransferase [Methanosarcinales archaeon]
MTFKIKKLETDKEIKAVAALAEEIWTEHYTPLIGAAQTEYMIRVFQSPERIKNDIKEKNYNYFAAFLEGGGEQAAYLALCPDERGVFISKIYVKKEYRRRGIAKMLVAFSLDFSKKEIRASNLKSAASKKDRPCLWLTVNKGNSGSIEFYKKEGFEIEKEAVTDIGQHFFMDDYIMALYFDAGE